MKKVELSTNGCNLSEVDLNIELRLTGNDWEFRFSTDDGDGFNICRNPKHADMNMEKPKLTKTQINGWSNQLKQAILFVENMKTVD